jgi:hypothetical protein
MSVGGEAMGVEERVPLEQIEHTIAIDVPPEHVYQHLATVEGLAIVDLVTGDWRGGRAILVVAPDAADGATLTMMAESPEGAEAGVEMRVRMRQELERIAATLERRAGVVGRGDPSDPSAQTTDVRFEAGLPR